MRLAAGCLWTICGCLATAAAADGALYPKGSWANVAYRGFAESIDALTGQGAHDCGFIEVIGESEDFSTRRKAKKTRAAANACVQQALRGGEPFKFGAVHLPIDSYTYEVLARATDGKLWLIVYDVMIDGTAGQQWNKVCESVSIDDETLFMKGIGCADMPDGVLEKP